ncbi:MAG: hypothetical protein ACJAZ1_001647 [Yoonia sp.]|jgi:hypothetical protein
MSRFASAFALIVTMTTAPAFAQSAPNAEIDKLFTALGLPDIVEVMLEEGLAYSTTLGEEMLPVAAVRDWADAAQSIYDPQAMLDDVRDAFETELQGDDLEAMLAFFTSEAGTRIIALEVSARRALLNEAVEEASTQAATVQMRDETPRYLLVKDFVDANDLIESNVVGSLNSSYAFYTGLIDGGAMPAGVTRDTALQDVWAQEPDIRDSTTEWIYSFLLMAYQPLSDAELETYIAFSKTEAGQQLTAALFVAFDGMFEDISRALGLNISRLLLTQEL